jgi:hypothetical protein
MCSEMFYSHGGKIIIKMSLICHKSSLPTYVLIYASNQVLKLD